MAAVVNNQKLWGLKKAFYKNVAAMHREEVFGVANCNGLSWECIFKDYMILQMATCHTTEVLTQSDMDCLIGKVTNDCNC